MFFNSRYAFCLISPQKKMILSQKIQFIGMLCADKRISKYTKQNGQSYKW